MAMTLRDAARRGLAAMVALGPVALAGGLLPAGAQSDPNDALIQLLDQRSCRRCRLQDVDLVHADLREADLQGAQLQRANLSNARLDGANLSGADLSFTSLAGASLRGTDLRGARLSGTDLTRADLSGARLDTGALSRSHWQQAVGIRITDQTYAELHNAGVSAALAGRQPEAERYFSEAIIKQPDAAISWVGRGISRSRQGKQEQAAQDLSYASALYAAMGDTNLAAELQRASAALSDRPDQQKGGNGAGSALLGGSLAAVRMLAPLAIRAFAPVGF